jgi:ribosomal protein S18 acetylase RimI-like enzyme
MNIRTAAQNDADVIADFNIRLAWETEALKLDPGVVRRGVEALFKDPGKGIYFVAEVKKQASAKPDEKQEIAGQLMITYEWSDWRDGNIWWIQSVYVKEEFRGQGVFRALFAHVQKLAEGAPEVCALRLYMDKHNDQARLAYGKLGMIEGSYVVFEKGLRGRTGD